MQWKEENIAECTCLRRETTPTTKGHPSSEVSLAGASRHADERVERGRKNETVVVWFPM